MTDIHGVDECGIYARPLQHVAHTFNPGNSPGDRNQAAAIPPRTNERSQINISYRGSNISTDCPRQRQSSQTEEDRSASLGIIKFNGPTHPNFVTEQARLKSFSFWPPALPQKPQELAEAGFFYTGRSDQVKCFYCDGGLESWEPSDSPLGEHVKWFGECAFVKMKVGNEEFGNKETTVAKPMNGGVEYKPKGVVEDGANAKKEIKPLEIKDTSKVEKISTNVEGLQKQVQTLREERSCKICLEKEASIVFLPCGHLCSCVNCAPALRVCAVCRAPIQGLVRTYMA